MTLDSAIYGPLFTDPEIAELLGDQASVRALVQVEVALARAEARLGVIPSQAAEQIERSADPDKITLPALTAGTISSGFPIIPLVHELKRLVGPDANEYVHWGATTQDIMDTARVLQFRAVINVFQRRLTELTGCLGDLADSHSATVLAGRTHGQQAVPVTFGLKVAAWVAPLLRDAERVQELSARLLVVQFGGAAGTLAALGALGLAVQEELANELGLGTPIMPWHAQRDNFAEFAGWLSLVTGSLGKIAQDIILLTQSEVAEAAESAEAGRGGSSTMPQKSNPITSELILAAARTNAVLLSAVHQAIVQEHERATHGWQVEWLTLPQMIILAGGALKNAIRLAKSVVINSEKMRENIRQANDVVLAEAAVWRLTPTMSREDAEALVKQACVVAASEDKPLIAVLQQSTRGKIPEDAVDWSELALPENYLGETKKMIEAVLQRTKKLSTR